MGGKELHFPTNSGSAGHAMKCVACPWSGHGPLEVTPHGGLAQSVGGPVVATAVESMRCHSSSLRHGAVTLSSAWQNPTYLSQLQEEVCPPAVSGCEDLPQPVLSTWGSPAAEAWPCQPVTPCLQRMWEPSLLAVHLRKMPRGKMGSGLALPGRALHVRGQQPSE